MKYEAKKKPGSQADVHVTLEHEEFLSHWQPIYDKALAQVQIKGFRPGTAPKELADHAIDKEAVFQEAVSHAVRGALKEIVEKEGWELIDQPKIEVLDSEKGLKFKTSLTLFPEVTIGDYKKIGKKIEAEKKITPVEEAEIKKAIDWVLNSRAKLIRSAIPTRMGDVVDIEFAGTLDGKPLDGASGSKDQFVLGDGRFVPGFEEALVNHKEGETVEFPVTFPKEYWSEHLRNKKVDFKVLIKATYYREIPKLDDEFVKNIGKFDTVVAFEKNIKEGLQQEKEYKERERLELKMLDEIGKSTKADIPDVMIARTLDQMVEEYRNSAGDKEDEASIKEKLKESARKSVLNNLVLYQIAKAENLEPSHEDIEKEANHFLARNQFSKNPNVDPQQLYDYIYGVVRNKKVFDYLHNLK